MDANKMTPRELRDLAEEMEQAGAKEDKPDKVGKLRHDLYMSDDSYTIDDYELYTKKECNSMLKFENIFNLRAKKGTTVFGYNQEGSEECYWWSEDDTIEGMPNVWAEKNLIGIKEIK